jgi:hypothetical protein
MIRAYLALLNQRLSSGSFSGITENKKPPREAAVWLKMPDLA